jgi:opine dehydrogenase
MRGHSVSILKLSDAIHREHFNTIKARGSIVLEGIQGQGEFPIAKITRDPAEVIAEAEVVFIYYVANYQPQVAQRCAEFFHERQTVVLTPGYCGSLIFRRFMDLRGRRRFPLFGEFETLPYSSRLGPHGSVAIVSRNVRHPFAAFPASRGPELRERLEPILGNCVPRLHILEVALHNPNLVIHTAGVLLNLAQVESRDHRFALYREGFTASVWNVVAQLDKEKMDVLERVGAPRVPYFDEFRTRTFEDTTIDAMEGFRHYASEAPDGPFAVDHRYVTEDVPMGLGLLHSLGKATGVATPVAQSLIHLACAVLPRHDFWAEARTLESFWAGTLEQLLALLRE